MPGFDIRPLSRHAVGQWSGYLATVLRTMPGDRLNSKWHRYGVNLTGYAGKTVTLRIAEVDNLGEFHVGVDAVKLKSKRVSGGG